MRRVCGERPVRPGRGRFPRASGAAALAAFAALVPSAAPACPFCGLGGVDAWPFIALVVGGFIAGAAMILAWSLRTGQYDDPEGTSRRVLELDRITGVKI